MKTYDGGPEWTTSALAQLENLKRAEALLPENAPRALLSVRLSVLTADTTSPVRQELDLRLLARQKGYRVVGVASDLNVSATKVPPWRRRELGEWINNRVPEFDALLFWKLDRFIRRVTDLSAMIEWCERYGKNLVSKHDAIDLSTTLGRSMVTLIGGIAEIEAANTSTRVTSLWDYARTQDSWLVGKPAYGYVTTKVDGKPALAIEPCAHRALHWARRMALRGVSARRMARCLVRSGLMSAGLTTSTLLRRLRNPALMGYRVAENKQGGKRRSQLVLGDGGKPIRVGPPLFTHEEFHTLQAALDRRAKEQPTRQAGGATRFLGVLICADCSTNMTVQRNRRNGRTYSYLRCGKCKGGGLGAPGPQNVYDILVDDVLRLLGDFPVQVREYAPGAEARAEVERLEEAISHYMTELAPGGRFTKTRFTRERAEKTLEELTGKLNAIDPETTQDRWILVHNGRTFRQMWEAGGMEAMAEDLRRVGVTCEVTRKKVQGVRAPSVQLRLKIPRDVRERLVIKGDDFPARR
ncbi:MULTISPECIES: recombinase family protein [Streptomyces]|uniref:Recombinase family protein n=1 Tax=Streptomyces albus TaxID=1888 RepID=A0A8H1LG26_9ACTN|nr:MULTISPECIES: recombinase family protein [Streptomyces]KPC94128.1 serine recombinase [Streptomyces sp. NRRL F-6602]TGG83415.1 recombinase family protein [Streptomyces albus]UVN56828.1 recombinase family protein [Streptomyces albus]